MAGKHRTTSLQCLCDTGYFSLCRREILTKQSEWLLVPSWAIGCSPSAANGVCSDVAGFRCLGWRFFLLDSHPCEDSCVAQVLLSIVWQVWHHSCCAHRHQNQPLKTSSQHQLLPVTQWEKYLSNHNIGSRWCSGLYYGVFSSYCANSVPTGTPYSSYNWCTVEIPTQELKPIVINESPVVTNLKLKKSM